MLRLTLILASVAAALVSIGWLLHLNPESVTLRLTSTRSWEAPLPVVLLATLMLGAALTFAYSLIRAGRHALVDWRAQRSSRRHRRQDMRKEQGLGLAWLGETEKARGLLSKALRDFPDDLTAFLLFAQTYLLEGDYRRAHAVLEEGLDRRGQDPRLLLFLGEAQRGLGEHGAAVETLERARRADPVSPRVLAALREAYAAVGRWADAGRVQEAYLLLVQEPSRHAEAERRLVGLRYQGALAAADPAARITALRGLLRSHPDFDPAAVSLGDALLETDQPRLAERVWWRAISRGARAGALERLERLLAGGPRAGRLDTLSRRLVRRHPDDGTVRLYRARQLVRLGRLDDAAGELAQVPAPWNSLPAYHALLAEVHVRRGTSDDAVTAFRQALAAGAQGGFRCEVCGREADDWRGHCDGCQSWGSYRSSFEPVTVGASAAPPSIARH